LDSHNGTNVSQRASIDAAPVAIAIHFVNVWAQKGFSLPLSAASHATPRTHARYGWSLWAPVIISMVCSCVFIARTAFRVGGELYFTLFDDAMISMRYARNLAEGHGLVWNVGQPPVEGYTNFLWTLWMALLHLLPFPESKMSLVVMLSGAVLLVAHLLVVRTIAALVAPTAPLVGSLSLWMTALCYPLIYWTLRGMEVGLITLWLSTSVLLTLRLLKSLRYRTLISLAALMALGLLVRPDVLVPCVVLSGYLVWAARGRSRWTIAIVLLGALVSTLAVHTTFRMLYYGTPLPNTYYLKLQGAALGARLSRGLLGLLVFDLLQMLVPVVLASGYLIARSRKMCRDHGECLLAIVFTALCAYSVYVGGDAWDYLQYANRYVTPAMPALLVLSAVGLESVLREQTRLRRLAVQGVAGLCLLLSVLRTMIPLTPGGASLTALDRRLLMLNVAVTLASFLLICWFLLPTPSVGRRMAALLTPARRRSIVAVLLTVVSLVAMNGRAVSLWCIHNAAYVEDEAWAARYGLALRAATADNATIAVTWAGAIPYFSHRTTIDLLGKSDPVIASREPQPATGFIPGHNKWDYRYSIGQLRPDVVAELWHASEADVREIEDWGYVRLAPWVFVRADSAGIDRVAVKVAACLVLRADPFVLGSAQRVVVDLEEIHARYCN
jgi:hypothetical protein